MLIFETLTHSFEESATNELLPNFFGFKKANIMHNESLMT